MKEPTLSYSSLKKTYFIKNMEALRRENVLAVVCLDRETINQKIQLSRGDKFVNGKYLINRHYEPLYQDDPFYQSHQYFNEYLNFKEPVLNLGSALGYGLIYLLKKSTIPKIYLYERDKSLLKITLTLHDFSEYIESGRLEIVLQEQIKSFAGKDISAIVPEPRLFLEYKVEFQTISRFLKRGCVAERSAIILSGALFVLDYASTLFEMGWDVFEIDESVQTSDSLMQLFNAINPDLIVKINLLKDLENFSGKWTIIEWEIDPTISPVAPIELTSNSNFFAYTHNAERLAGYRKKGYSKIEYLPLCSNPQKFHPFDLSVEAKQKFGCDVSFVGSLLRENQEVLIDGLLRSLKLLAQRSNPNWQKVIDWINALRNQSILLVSQKLWIEAFNNLLLSYQLPNELQMEGNVLLISTCVDEYLGYLWRRELINSFLPLGIHLWGDMDYEKDFPENHRGIADHYLDLPKIYAASKINLDISRCYQDNIITMRVFDVMACGGFVLAARNEALLELFTEDEEVVCYESPDEAVDKAYYYLQEEEEREAIALRAYEKVSRHHTFENRIKYMLQKAGIKP